MPEHHSPIRDPRMLAVVERMMAERRSPPRGGPLTRIGDEHDPYEYSEYGFPILPEQGALLYTLCRALGARRVVDFATSFGMSTLYLAAAIRDGGGGTVIGAELVPAKIEVARRNLEEAGLLAYVDIRQGDARRTLADVGGPVDLAMIDGWPLDAGASLARQVLGVLIPQLRPGAIVVNDNGEPDYLAFVRDPANGFISTSLPLKGMTEISVRTV